MSENVLSYLRAVRVDLVEKRLWPILVLLAVALVGVVVLLGHGSGANAPTSAAITPSGTADNGPVVSVAPANPTLAVSETTSGVQYQRQGGARDPFFPLADPHAASSAPAGPGAGGTTIPTPHITVPGGGGGGTIPSIPTTPTPSFPTPSTPIPSTPTPTPTPSVPTPVSPSTKNYHVELRFGPVASDSPPAPPIDSLSALKDYRDPARLTPLPDSSPAIVAFVGVRSNGQTVTFALPTGGIIPHGDGGCRPDPTNCQAIDLTPGHTETFDYFPANGPMQRYALGVVSVTAKSASSKFAGSVFNGRISPVGRRLLAKAALPFFASLRFSPARGVLLYRGH